VQREDPDSGACTSSGETRNGHRGALEGVLFNNDVPTHATRRFRSSPAPTACGMCGGNLLYTYLCILCSTIANGPSQAHPGSVQGYNGNRSLQIRLLIYRVNLDCPAGSGLTGRNCRGSRPQTHPSITDYTKGPP